MSSVDVLNAGRVGRPHGLDGSFHVTRPRPGLLSLGGRVQIGGEGRPGETRLEIVRRAGTDERPILRLLGVDDREGAEALRGKELFVDRAAAPELEAGEYWAEDLRGCRVVTALGRDLGVVSELRALPSCEVLEVGDLLVPMVGDAVLEVDIAARRIVVDAGFLGVDDPRSDAAGPAPAPAGSASPGTASSSPDAAEPASAPAGSASPGTASPSSDAARG